MSFETTAENLLALVLIMNSLTTLPADIETFLNLNKSKKNISQ